MMQRMTERKVQYREKVAELICDRLAAGESLLKILETKGMPRRSTVYGWRKARPEFEAAYVAARDEHCEREFDRLDALMAEVPPKDDKGRTDVGWVQLQRLKTDSLKYKLSIMQPQRFNERRAAAGKIEPEVPPAEERTPENLFEAARRIAFLLHKAGQQPAPAAQQPAERAAPPPPPAALRLPAPRPVAVYQVDGDRLVELNGDGIMYDPDDKH